MPNLMQLMPTLESDEMLFVQGIVKDLNETQIQQFATVYNSRRKDPQTVLLTAVAGFLGFAGIHRFLLGQIGMGVLMFFTGGFCFIGTIIDLINHKKLAFEANTTIAHQVAAMVRAAG
jgi:TM2 domain-containing membrane protein YozV